MTSLPRHRVNGRRTRQGHATPARPLHKMNPWCRQIRPLTPEAAMPKPKRPVIVSILAIAQLMVGGLWLACGVFSVGATLAGSSSAKITVRSGFETTTRVYDTVEEMEREAPGYKLFLLGSSVSDLILH